MARIRTIKPDFFTSDDVCALSPLARLLYIGLWCEADREGRMAWAPKVFKRRYLPDDQCDIESVCRELLRRDLVRLYGDNLAHIPSFARHQHVNPREAVSAFPEPPPEDASSRVSDASIPDVHAQVGRKEGKEGKGRDAASSRVHASELPDDWKPSDEDRSWAAKARPDLTPALLDEETERFRNHAKANNRTAHNWGPNWRNWISKSKPAEPQKRGVATPSTLPPDPDSAEQWRARIRDWRPGKFWHLGDWGPPPDKPGCRVPPAILSEWRTRAEAA